MQYLIYVLAYLPYAICGPLTDLQKVVSFDCQSAQGKIMQIPVADTRTSVQSSCSASKNPGKRIATFPKTFIPGLNQKMSATSIRGKYFIGPVNQAKYPNVFAVTSDGCELAAVMMAGPRGLSDSVRETPPGAVVRPGKSVRTRPGTSGAQSARTLRPVVGRSESSTGKIKKRAVKGSDLKPCSPKTFDFNRVIPGPGSRTPF